MNQRKSHSSRIDALTAVTPQSNWKGIRSKAYWFWLRNTVCEKANAARRVAVVVVVSERKKTSPPTGERGEKTTSCDRAISVRLCRHVHYGWPKGPTLGWRTKFEINNQIPTKGGGWIEKNGEEEKLG